MGLLGREVGRAVDCGGGREKFHRLHNNFAVDPTRRPRSVLKMPGIDGSNLADSLRLARTWPLLLFFKPRIPTSLQLYLDAALVPAEGRGRGCCWRKHRGGTEDMLPRLRQQRSGVL
ncbi:hypothetical protein VZT92_016218 [Zoarces viviparus]|uniref:Uncharacterized protein n=1 Tax=Zoarces viviparus TaxID=48416 RepID=A0AAW1ET09_ZOAVI